MPTLLPLPTATLVAMSPVSPSRTPAPLPTHSPSALPTHSPIPTATPSPRPTRTATPVATLNPAGRVGLGVYELASPYDEFAAVQEFEKLLQHKMQYVLWFQAWGDSDREFSEHWVKLAAEKGLVPVITWEPWKRSFDDPAAVQPVYSLQSIAAGAHDEYLRTWARSAKSLGIRFIIRFAHEQSTEPGTRSWYPWQGDPEAYKLAFRHMVSIFRQEGATQVQFLWSAMWLNQWASQYYPGDDVVDIVGTTAINHGTAVTTDWAQWRSFDDLFSGQYDAAQQWNKPIIVTELGTAEQGGSKVSWLRDCLLAMKPRYPRVEGLILFEVAQDREWPSINWSVASSAESLAAFRAALADPYFK